MANNDSDQDALAGPAAAAPRPSDPGPVSHLERFAKAFEASARRWELVVYPSLFAFIVLAAYGFFLVYSLTKDMRILSVNVDPRMEEHMTVMTASIERLSDTITAMNGTVAAMGESMRSIDTHMAAMKNDTGQMTASTQGMERQMVRINDQMAGISQKMNALDPILINMAGMNEHMKVMTGSIQLLSRDIGRPLNFMNQMSPW